MLSDFSFAGRAWDDEAELYYKNARWYDPHTGRFLSEDPIQEGANWYRYAGNDPINFRDPTGLSQAGNPLNNLFNGGFGGNVVAPRQRDITLNTSYLASPTLNYGALGSNAPTYSAQQLFGGPTRSSNTQVSLAFPNAVSNSSISAGTSSTRQRFATFANELGAAAIARTRAEVAESLSYRPAPSKGPGLDQIVDFAFAELGNASRYAGNTLGSCIEYATSGYGGSLGNFVAGVGGGAAQLARTAGNIGAVVDLVNKKDRHDSASEAIKAVSKRFSSRQL